MVLRVKPDCPTRPGLIFFLIIMLNTLSAVAATPFKQVVHYRHGTKMTFLQNTAKMALFGTVVRADLEKVFRRYGLTIKRYELIRGIQLLDLFSITGLTPQWRRISSDLASVRGFKGLGPVYFDGSNLTLATGRIWIYLPQTHSRIKAEALLKKQGLHLADHIKATHFVAIAVPQRAYSVLDAVRKLNSAGLDAEPELMRRYYLRLTPNDTYFGLQWHLDNTGTNVTNPHGTPITGQALADIRAKRAWDISTGSASTIVAVIDSGSDCTHPELASKCQNGFNAITGAATGQPPTYQEDRSGGHGTSVAGLAVAAKDDAGVIGVCPDCTLIPVRLIDRGTYLDDAMMLRAFKHPVDHGAGVINNSWGPQATGTYVVPIYPGEQEGLSYANTSGRGGKGTVVVYAAGNEDLDTKWYGPFHTGLTNVMVAAASTQFDQRSGYSNFGAHIDVTAPSNDYYLTPSIVTIDRMGTGDLASDYTRAFGGTSGSAPLVSGLAGLILSVNNNLTAAQVAQIIRDSADKIDFEGGLYDQNGHSPKYGYGRINAYRALLLAQDPQAVTCVATSQQEVCDTHLDENCNGYVDEGCVPASSLGNACSWAQDCGLDGYWKCPTTGTVRGFCTWDCNDRPCHAGYYCVDGLCAKQCNSQIPCSGNYVCNNETFGFCQPRCYGDGDCIDHERCETATGLCILDTDGKIGSRCISDECEGSPGYCLGEQMGFIGGYCTHECLSDASCDGLGKCITIYGSMKVCFKKCAFDGDCRPEYICQQAGPSAGTCYRKCTRDRHCTGNDPAYANVYCERQSGRCIDPSLLPCTDDSREENDTALDAATLQAGGYSNLMLCPEDDDWYIVGLRGGSSLTARANFTHASGDLNLELYDAFGTLLTSSSTTDDNEEVSHTPTETTYAYIRVFGVGRERDTYSLEVHVVCPANFCQNNSHLSGLKCDGADLVTCGDEFACGIETSRLTCKHGCLKGRCKWMPLGGGGCTIGERPSVSLVMMMLLLLVGGLVLLRRPRD